MSDPCQQSTHRRRRPVREGDDAFGVGNGARSALSCRADGAASGWLLPTINVTARVAGLGNFESPIFPVEFASTTSSTGPVVLVGCLRRMGAITAGSDESMDGSLCRGYHPCAVAELSVGHCSRASSGYSTLVLEIAVLAIFSHVLESVHLPSYMPTLGGLMSP